MPPVGSGVVSDGSGGRSCGPSSQVVRYGVQIPHQVQYELLPRFAGVCCAAIWIMLTGKQPRCYESNGRGDVPSLSREAW